MTRAHRVSASSVWLTEHCLAWARPDWADPPKKTNAKMERGTRIHGYIEDLHHNRGLSDKAKTEEVECAKSAIGYIGYRYAHAASLMLEVPLAWDWETDACRVLPSVGHRDYSHARATEIPGTVDLVALNDGVVSVLDWKSGHSRWANYGPQVRFLAMAAAGQIEHERAEGLVAKLLPSGATPSEEYQLDMFDLASERETLRARMRTLPTAEPQPGAHCTYCNSKSLCPVYATPF